MIIIIAVEDKFTPTTFSLCIKFHQELSVFVFVRVYCLEVVCSQTLQVQWFPSQHLTMDMKLFKLPEVFMW